MMMNNCRHHFVNTTKLTFELYVRKAFARMAFVE